MRAFAALLDRLVLTPQRYVKLKLLTDYFRATPDPDRGYALAALTGELNVASVKPMMLRDLVIQRIDPELFYYSHDYVGDFAETIALIWPEARTREAGWPKPGPADAAAGLSTRPRRLAAEPPAQATFGDLAEAAPGDTKRSAPLPGAPVKGGSETG